MTYNRSEAAGLQQSIDAARSLGVVLAPVGVSSTNANDLTSLDQAIDAASDAEAFVVNAPLGGEDGFSRIAARPKDFHLASIGAENQFAKLGGLAAYGANSVATHRRAGYFVDRILKGARPAELPVEVPTVFDVAFNRSTAAAIGVTIPPEVALQVTEWVP
jgi:putative ABC transport system substrate-binding protein